MKRLWNLIRTDIKFQIRYGFYFLYAVLTIVYLFVLSAVPEQIKEKAVQFLIFSDPAMMGLFFMGAIVMLERNQRVLETLAVSPVRFEEYLCGKIISIGFISMGVSGILMLGTGGYRLDGLDARDILSKLLTVFAGSMFFSLFGLLAALYAESLNQFVLLSAPIEFFLGIPGMLWIFGMDYKWLSWHPGVLTANGIDGNVMAVGFVFLWAIAAFAVVKRTAEKRFRKEGGISL